MLKNPLEDEEADELSPRHRINQTLSIASSRLGSCGPSSTDAEDKIQYAQIIADIERQKHFNNKIRLRYNSN